MTQAAQEAYNIIQQKCPDFKAKFAIVLGSGLGGLADHIAGAIRIPYQELPGFHISSVAGHQGNLILGRLHDQPVACLQGRAHYYEGVDRSAMQTMIRTLHLLGADIFLGTNASGSLREDVGPGSLVLINDHINFQFNNPLVGPNDENFGPRFVALEDAYDPKLRTQFHAQAQALGVTLHEGVYIGVLGPSFETPAEIRAYKLLGADLVGMSTIPDVIIARHCGMKVAVVAVITNFAAGMNPTHLSHEETISNANKASDKMIRLIMAFVEHYGE